MSEQETVETVETVVETETVEESTCDSNITSLIERLQSLPEMQINLLSKEVKSCVSELKNIQKEFRKEMKKKTKRTKRTSTRDPNAEPSGFARPTKISDELSAFLKTHTNSLEYTDKKTKTTKKFESLGDLVARTEVTRRLSSYISSKNLRREDDKKFLDFNKEGGSELKTLLRGVPDGEDLTHFTMQKYLKHHYSTASSNASSTVTTSPSEVVETPTPVTKIEAKTTTARTARTRRAARA